MDKDILLASKTLVESMRHAYVTLAAIVFFSKWPTSSRFVELSEDGIYYFSCLLFVIVNAYF